MSFLLKVNLIINYIYFNRAVLANGHWTLSVCFLYNVRIAWMKAVNLAALNCVLFNFFFSLNRKNK